MGFCFTFGCFLYSSPWENSFLNNLWYATWRAATMGFLLSIVWWIMMWVTFQPYVHIQFPAV